MGKNNELTLMNKITAMFFTAFLGLFAWILFELNQTTISIAEIKKDIYYLKESMSKIEGKTQDRYTSNDATRDFEILSKSIDDNKNKINRCCSK